MFEISFTDDPVFAIDGAPHRYGSIQFNSREKERFVAPLSHWTERDYERQWHDGIARLLAGDRRSCLVTWAYDPSDMYYVQWWALYVLDTRIAVQEQLLSLADTPDSKIDLHDPYRLLASEDHRFDPDGSTWYADIADLTAFVSRARSRDPSRC